MTSEIKKYQISVAKKLETTFDDVKTEWRTEMIGMYSPRIDVAVGPFATGDKKYGKEYDRLLEEPATAKLIKALLKMHNVNCASHGLQNLKYVDFKSLNNNARCFLAIEIENQVSRKHLLGGIINASALGRLAVIVPGNDKLPVVLNALSYLHYLTDVKKNGIKISNLVIITKEQLMYELDSLCSNVKIDNLSDSELEGLCIQFQNTEVIL